MRGTNVSRPACPSYLPALLRILAWVVLALGLAVLAVALG
jgi:hypothetical protein